MGFSCEDLKARDIHPTKASSLLFAFSNLNQEQQNYGTKGGHID